MRMAGRTECLCASSPWRIIGLCVSGVIRSPGVESLNSGQDLSESVSLMSLARSPDRADGFGRDSSKALKVLGKLSRLAMQRRTSFKFRLKPSRCSTSPTLYSSRQHGVEKFVARITHVDHGVLQKVVSQDGPEAALYA